MHPVLADLVIQFREAQDRGVAFVARVLGPTLGVQLPSSNREWVTICGETGLYNVRWVNGAEVYSHGYGIELIFDGLTIDFDWGDAGEPDGFDAWRLWHFARVNRLPGPSASYSQVESWLGEAHGNGELTRGRLLYYSPRHRARRADAGTPGE